MKQWIKYFAFLIAALFISYSLYGDATNSWDGISNFAFSDTDDTVRILEVRNWLNGQGFYDLYLHRANPPYGASMHWSRISDAPLALGQLILRPFFGVEMAEKLAIFAVPVCLAIIFLLIVGTLAKKINNSSYSYPIALLLFLYSVSANFNFVSGRVDHHGLQIISLICLAYGFIRADIIGGIMSGISLGLSLAIGFEILPLQAIMVSWLAIVWAINPLKYQELTISFSISLIAALSFGFIVNIEPKNYLVSTNDALSIAQYIPIIVGASLLAISAKFGSTQGPLTRFGQLFAIGIIVIIAALQFPELRKPLYWQISPILYELWLAKNGEVVPMIKRPYIDQMAVGGVFVVGIIFAIIRLLTLKGGEQKTQYDNVYNWSLLLTALSAASLMTFFFQTRVHSHATSLALLVFACAVPMAFSRGALNMFIIALVAIMPFVKTNAQIAAQKSVRSAGSDYDFGSPKRCQAIGDFAHLASQSKGLVAANISLGAQALIATHHDVLTTAYHRDWGRDYLFDIYTGTSEEAKAKIEKRGIEYFAFCIRDLELENMVKYRPHGFLADVLEGRLPDYLVEIPPPNGSQIRAFKVIGASK